jgi:hypothetical protein
MDGGVACATTLCVCVVVVSTERQTSAFRVIACVRACGLGHSFIHAVVVVVVVVVRADGGA